MGKRRAPGVFDDNPFIEGFLEWMVSPDGQVAGEVSALVFAARVSAGAHARRRKLIWAVG